MQLLSKFKKILYMGFRATLNFRKLVQNQNYYKRAIVNNRKRSIQSALGLHSLFLSNTIRVKTSSKKPQNVES